MAKTAWVICLIHFVASATAAVVTGPEDPRLASFDRLMISFVDQHKVPGAALAVARDGQLVYARGFGYADVEARQPVQPNSLFRIASVSKPFTSAAIMQLAQAGKLRLADTWYPILGLHPRNDQHVDPRLKQITILELLQHRGGWDRDKSFDPMFRSVLIARTLGARPPADQEQITQYMLGQPLDFDPGERYAYSNFGYCILGQVIHKVSHEPYEQYVREHVLSPLGIHNMRQGRSLPRYRAPSEVKYYGSGMGTSVFAENLGQRVPWCYGGWDLEAMDSHGGWIASAVDLVRFGTAFNHPDHSKILSARSIQETFARPPGEAGLDHGKPGPVFYGCGWSVRDVGGGNINTWHTGLLDGTSTLLVRRSDGLTWAVLFNASQDPRGKNLADQIDPLVHKAADEVRHWPDEDLFAEFLRADR
ncbi:MAG TPA: serine hydrolase domain-containing protein [Tepidisphaeraceae bacterium]|nr:serine hydrolase domain-containing protein [Tepidisphaeraceae bacterium]